MRMETQIPIPIPIPIQMQMQMQTRDHIYESKIITEGKADEGRVRGGGFYDYNK